MQTTLRRALLGALLALSMGLLGTPMAHAAPSTTTLQNTELERLAMPIQWGGGYCERLRRACQYKEYRGEVGEGNCSRYRAECLGGSSYCDRLRRACQYKDYRGEAGEGNCRRYRNECGGY